MAPHTPTASRTNIDDLKNDVRFAFRQFRRQPRFWAVIALMRVVGIASTTSIFAIVDGVLLKPLPYREPGRMVSCGEGFPE